MIKLSHNSSKKKKKTAGINRRYL